MHHAQETAHYYTVFTADRMVLLHAYNTQNPSIGFVSVPSKKEMQEGKGNSIASIFFPKHTEKKVCY